MKFSIPLLLVLFVCPLLAEPQPAPAPEEKATKIRFKGKAGAPANLTITATRSGNQSNIRLVIIAPGHGAVTCLETPRLWWYQSETTAPRDLEFVLSRLDGPEPAVILRSFLPAMPKGFNNVDLRNPALNKLSVKLADGGNYQWTIRLAAEPESPQVFCRLSVKIDKTRQTLATLSESGNWYELFDLICTASEKEGVSPEVTEARTELIEQIGLAKEIRRLTR